MRTDAVTKLIQHLAFFGESHRELDNPFPRSKRMSAAPSSADDGYGRRILGRAIQEAPSELLVSVLAEKMTDEQLEELINAKKRKREEADGAKAKKRKAVATSSATVSLFASLPDELVLKIIKFAAGTPSPKLEYANHWLTEKYDHDLLANCLSQVSMRFKRISADVSLWKGDVWIGRFTKIETIEWVIRNCLNGGTTSLSMPENDDATGYDMFTYRYSYRRRKTLSQIDPHTNYPNMMVKLWRTYGRGRRIWERREAGLLHRLRQRLR